MVNASPEELLEPSDEEVLAASDLPSESDDDFEDAEEGLNSPKQRSKPRRPSKDAHDSDSEASASPEEDEDAEGWGSSKRDYYDADVIETEADALEEEKEARRLQQKQLQDMTEADFGLDETDWKTAGKDGVPEDDDSRGRVICEVLPPLEITESMSVEERLEILRSRYPEFEPLAKEYRDLQAGHEQSNIAAAKANVFEQTRRARLNGSVDEEDLDTPAAVIKHTALSAYLAALSVCFALFTSHQDKNGRPAAMPPTELREHPVMDILVKCRDLWQKVKDLTIPDPDAIAEIEAQEANGDEPEAVVFNDKEPENENLRIQSKKKEPRKSKAQKTAEAAQAKASARRAEDLLRTEEDLASLSTLITKSQSSKKITAAKHKPTDNDSSSDIGEQTSLIPHEAAEKAKRKKSLRFYTSQIAQKANRRGAAGRDAGGDDDIPYRERRKDKEARLNAEAEKRGLKSTDVKSKSKSGGKGDDDLGGPSDEEDRAVAREMHDAERGSGSEDYYHLIASKAAEKKASKAALAAAHVQAAKEGGVVRIVPDETAEGKRGISYQIEKNKGITPTRNKLNKNPRVKKRKK